MPSLLDSYDEDAPATIKRAKIVVDKDKNFYGIRFKCPGCVYSDGSPMSVILAVNWLPAGKKESPLQQGKPHWSFNGDFEHPVFGPSINSWWGGTGVGDDYIPKHVCHCFVGCNGAAPGQITFLGDCTHALKGQTVDLPDVNASTGDE